MIINKCFTFCRLKVILDSSDAYKECFLKRTDFCAKPPRAMNYFLNFDDGNLKLTNIDLRHHGNRDVNVSFFI